ncbi:NADH dehydrogenase [ubiquinone] 1 beta subcomplex subunit 2-like [Actinidia eriantha]|uniref:NADH dehydrogenase [ubiquinone] 1 beta subcomplex subunit 2-like n=1 Tax=Actinidia eriantha TaxID=165200 RepID=UPI002584F047|nr:NADH dehydrogenase [ubiquinone] 1 beta subcomplex subunit 2-like [Actinidia eriantha]
MGGGHGGHGQGTTYKGLTMHPPKRWHVITGKGMCAMMWFWILYRAKQDGPVVLISFRVGDILGKAMNTIQMTMGINMRHPIEELKEKGI